MTRRWATQGSAFEIDWAGRSWTLRPDADRPGLSPSEGEPLQLLALAGVAEPGRWEPGVLSAASLVDLAVRAQRVEATYRPAGWHDLIVRASWSPRDADGIDLEVQVNTLSVGQLRRVEVFVASSAGPLPHASDPRTVVPANARAAGLSYDGREPNLTGLTTAPPLAVGPRLVSTAGEAQVYAEWAHPQDTTRRIESTSDDGWTTRHGLFGHDLEKGFVLRARLRGFWLPPAGAEEAVRSRYDQFLNEPPPLLT